MKRLLSLISALIILLSLSACTGNWDTVNLQDAVKIPDNGVISPEILEQMRSEKAIVVFTGASAGLEYEWTIFGTSITRAKEINLGIELTKNAEDLQVVLNQTESFGFSATLSIYLDAKWSAQSAAAYVAGERISSVSLTGTEKTIVNITLDGSQREFVIRQDAVTNDTISENATTPSGEKDKYQTDPIPEGKPKPVEPEDQNIDQQKTYTCTFSIECSTILNNLDLLEPEKLEMVPYDGVILAATTVTFYEGESVYDVLQRVCRDYSIHMEAEWTPIYNSAYIEGIHNLYEFDCGSLSGWMYRVNGWYPNYGCSRYQLCDGDIVEWRYTCDLGNDVGGGYAVGG